MPHHQEFEALYILANAAASLQNFDHPRTTSVSSDGSLHPDQISSFPVDEVSSRTASFESSNPQRWIQLDVAVNGEYIRNDAEVEVDIVGKASLIRFRLGSSVTNKFPEGEYVSQNKTSVCETHAVDYSTKSRKTGSKPPNTVMEVVEGTINQTLCTTPNNPSKCVTSEMILTSNAQGLPNPEVIYYGFGNSFPNFSPGSLAEKIADDTYKSIFEALTSQYKEECSLRQLQDIAYSLTMNQMYDNQERQTLPLQLTTTTNNSGSEGPPYHPITEAVSDDDS